jgi:hypothetical protein
MAAFQVIIEADGGAELGQDASSVSPDDVCRCAAGAAFSHILLIGVDEQAFN